MEQRKMDTIVNLVAAGLVIIAGFLVYNYFTRVGLQ